MDLNKLTTILSNIEYKPNSGFVICRKVDGGWLIKHFQKVTDSYTHETKHLSGRKWYISQHMVESEVLNTCLLAILTFEEHEARELFKYRGRRLYGPHIDISQTQLRDHSSYDLQNH